MKKMSCFCASNTSGDSVYSGYLRWRMGLPLPPIPKEESIMLQNTNKMIIQDIDGVKNVNDLTCDDEETNEQTLKRFRRRKRQESHKNDCEQSYNNAAGSTKHFRENPLYISKSMDNNVKLKGDDNENVDHFTNFDMQVPSNFTESFVDETLFKESEESVSSFLVNRFFDTMKEYSTPYVTAQSGESSSPNNTNLQKTLDDVVSSLTDYQVFTRSSTVFTSPTPLINSPPAIPPHRKQMPSIIFEEESIIEEDDDDDEEEDEEEIEEKENVEEEDKEEEEEVGECKMEIEKKEEEVNNVEDVSIPIFSLKGTYIDRVMNKNNEYDYAYNKNWSKGVQLNLSLNLVEEQQKELAANQKSEINKRKSLFRKKREGTSMKYTSNNKENQLPPLSSFVLRPSLNKENSADEIDDYDDDRDSRKELSLKISSIEADALRDESEIPISPTKVSRHSAMTNESEETTDSRIESWDVIHGQFVKEITATRFLDPAMINTKPQPQSFLPPPPPPPIPLKPASFPISPRKFSLPISVSSSPSSTASITTSTPPIITSMAMSTSYLPLQHSPLPLTTVSTHKQHRSSSSRTQQYKAATITPSMQHKFIINIDPNVPLDNQRWYHYNITRSQAESLLHSNPDGSFLVRRSESNENGYSLSIKHRGMFLHMKITGNAQSGYILGEYGQPYSSIPHMLYHYCLTMVPVKGTEAACLRYAVARDL